MADELTGLPQNIAPWFPPANPGSNAAAEDQAFQREMVPYSLLLARAGQYIPMGDLSGVAPSENIIYDTVDPFERAAARLRAPYAAAVAQASAPPPIGEGPFDRLRNEAQQSIADNYARAMGVGAGDPFERAASRLRAPYAAANLRTSGLPDVAAVLANKFSSAVTAPRDALTGAMQVTDPETGMPTPEAIQRGQGLANLAMTGGIPFARQGAAGMAGGKLAQPTIKVADDGTRISIAPANMEIPEWGKGLSWGLTAYRSKVEGEDVIHIRDARLPSEMHGQGLGTAMYERAAELAAKENKPLLSDGSVTEDAANRWMALNRKGYNVQMAPDKMFRPGPPEAPQLGRFETPDGSPVFRVEPKK